MERVKKFIAIISTLVILFSFPSRKTNAKSEVGALLYGKYSKAECVLEANSRRILYAENSKKQLPMASTTKILTAICVIENCKDFSEEFPCPISALGKEGSSAYLKAGELYSVQDLLYGLMLRSGNDCAESLAIHTSGSIENFSSLMNETAQKIGAYNSSFHSPHGLPCKDHYTTAEDLSLITAYAMQNAAFREIVSTKYYKPRNYVNKNKMLDDFDGAVGVKTGYTKEAGRCLVTAAYRNNMTLICTVLSCPQMYERSKVLLEDAFSSYKNEEIISTKTTFNIKNGKKNIKAKTNKPIYYPLLEEERELIRFEIEKSNFLKRKKSGDYVGIVKIYLANRLLFSEKLYKL